MASTSSNSWRVLKRVASERRADPDAGFDFIDSWRVLKHPLPRTPLCGAMPASTSSTLWRVLKQRPVIDSRYAVADGPRWRVANPSAVQRRDAIYGVPTLHYNVGRRNHGRSR